MKVKRLKSMSSLRAIALVGLSVMLFVQSGCATVTMRPGGGEEVSNSPSYEETQSYFLFGLVGENEVNVNEACKGREIVQMQRQDTFMDGVLTVITLGIYAPTTARVWCGGAK